MFKRAQQLDIVVDVAGPLGLVDGSSVRARQKMPWAVRQAKVKGQGDPGEMKPQQKRP